MTALDGGRLASYQKARTSPSVWRLVSKHAPLIVPCRESAGTPFYCIHPVAGDISSYQRLFSLIDRQQGLYGIQVPKAKMNRYYIQSIYAIAQKYFRAIELHCPTGPLMIGGYSAGAIIALEVAQLLRGAGRDVQLLVAIDGAPLNSEADLKLWHPHYLWKLICNVPRWLLSRRLEDWSLEGIRRRFVDKLVFRSSGCAHSQDAGTAPVEHLDIVAGIVGRAGWDADQVSFIRSLYDALHDYVPRPYEGKVIVFETRIQPLFAVLQTSRIWTALALRCDCIEIQGDHTTVLDGGRATSAVAGHLNRVFRKLRDASA